MPNASGRVTPKPSLALAPKAAPPANPKSPASATWLEFISFPLAKLSIAASAATRLPVAVPDFSLPTVFAPSPAVLETAPICPK